MIDLHKETKKMFDMLFLAPTLKEPKVGVCMTCNPMKRKFINQLMDLENNRSCFILNHEIESLGGVNEMEFQKINEDIEYQEWKMGRIEL